MSRFSTELQKYFFLPPLDDLGLVPDAKPEGAIKPKPNHFISTSGSTEPLDDEGNFSGDMRERVVDDERTITMLDLLDLAGERTFGVLLVLLALPSALPIPAPGYSTPFGFVIVLLALQMIVGLHRPWFPGFVRNRAIKRRQARRVVAMGLPWLQRLESLSRPRFSLLCSSRMGHIAIGLVIVLMGLCMMIPVPGTNTIPAAIVFILGFSLIEEDGLISLMGLTAGLVGGTVVAFTLIKGLPLLWDQIQALIESRV